MSPYMAKVWYFKMHFDLFFCCMIIAAFNRGPVYQTNALTWTCWTRRSGSQSPLQFMPEVFYWVAVRTSHVLPHQNSLIHVFMDLALCTDFQLCWNRKGQSQNCYHIDWSMKLSKISWNAESLRVPLTGNKGPVSQTFFQHLFSATGPCR